MTNFDFLLEDTRFESFARSAVNSELLLHIDTQACVLSCRRTLECALKWMYTADEDLKMPYDQTLIKLINNKAFKAIVGNDIYRRLDFIRRMGNIAAHSTVGITEKQASLCIENLFEFLDFVAYCYSDNYTQKSFDSKLLSLTTEEALSFVTEKTVDIERLIAENYSYKKSMTQNRISHKQSYVSKPMFSNRDNSKLYVFSMLDEAGWVLDKNLKSDVLLEDGFCADFVLYSRNNTPIGIVMVMGTDRSIRKRSASAAELLFKENKVKPGVFFSNGFETYMDKGISKAKKVSDFYSPEELWSIVNNCNV